MCPFDHRESYGITLFMVPAARMSQKPAGYLVVRVLVIRNRSCRQLSATTFVCLVIRQLLVGSIVG